jgi:hypothetical protein
MIQSLIRINQPKYNFRPKAYEVHQIHLHDKGHNCSQDLIK